MNHMHEPEEGPNGTRCKLCGVPLSAVLLDVRRGYGAVASGVNGVVAESGERPITKDDLLDRIQNRKQRRARKAEARRAKR